MLPLTVSGTPRYLLGGPIMLGKWDSGQTKAGSLIMALPSRNRFPSQDFAHSMSLSDLSHVEKNTQLLSQVITLKSSFRCLCYIHNGQEPQGLVRNRGHFCLI